MAIVALTDYHCTNPILSNFSYNQENNQWIAEHSKYPDFQAVLKSDSALGPKEWTIHNDSKLCSWSASYITTLSLSSCSMDQFTCNDGNCVDIVNRCNGIQHCKDGSDEEQCRLVVPSLGYNKNLIPPPIADNQDLFINVSYNIKHILYIDEVENFMRITWSIQKEWYNSFLTYQNLKNGTVNQIFQEDKNMIWTPWINSNNIESTDKEKRANDVEVMKVVPNSNFKFMHNSKTIYQNALLFKVDINI